MLKVIRERLFQGYRTAAFPDAPAPKQPERFRGLPMLESERCPEGCAQCVSACPTDAIKQTDGRLSIDLGRCLFCTECISACPENVIAYSNDFRLAVRNRDDLLLRDNRLELAKSFDDKMRRIFGRSLKLRQVSAGGCNACEADVNVLNTVVFDLSRFGVQFVASPRHADGILITGPVTLNMREALKQTYDAVPEPKFVIAVGACAISGGPYVDHPEQLNGADSVVPVDLYIPGCPPSPWTILDGILRLMGRIDDARSEQPNGTKPPGSDDTLAPSPAP